MRYNQKFRVGIIQGNKGVARPGVIDEFMQELAGEHFDALGHDDTKMHLEDQKAFIISRMTVELYEEVEIRTVVDGFTWVSEGKAANFPRNYEIQQDGVVKARGAAVWALVDLANERLIRAKDFDIGSNFDEPVEEEKVVFCVIANVLNLTVVSIAYLTEIYGSHRLLVLVIKHNDEIVCRSKHLVTVECKPSDLTTIDMLCNNEFLLLVCIFYLQIIF